MVCAVTLCRLLQADVLSEWLIYLILMEIMLLGSLHGLLYFADAKDLGEIPVWSPPSSECTKYTCGGKKCDF